MQLKSFIVLIVVIFAVCSEPLSAQGHHHDHPHSHETHKSGSPLQTGDISEIGRASVHPEIGVVGNFGTWTVTYTIGGKGIQKEGGIKVQFPDEWHYWERNSAIPLQASNPVLGEQSKLHLAFLDKYNNPVDSFRGEVSFEIIQGEIALAESVELLLDRGWTNIEFIPSKSGVLRIKASALDGLYTAFSNPVQVIESADELKTYWGDLHSHSEYSHDGVGTESFDYARNIARLDFYALTDHTSQPDSDGYIRNLWHDIYDEYTAMTDIHYDPGHFATIHAMEVSFGTPWGHHNLYYRGEPIELYSPDVEGFSLPKLWDLLVAGEALTIPHHTAKMVRDISWTPHDPEFRRNFEIYSGHGLSEEFDPSHPLAAGASDFTSPSSPHMLPQYAQDVWKLGLKLSTIAASDDHISQPGKPHYGLTAVKATGLTREEIFDALYNRRTYGTTGERILLDFKVNGSSMGQKIQSGKHPLLEFEVHGTDDIEWVEVLRYTEIAGDFEVINRVYPNTTDFYWSGIDYGFSDDSIYYIRLKQAGLVEGRVVMAWSSPVWVKDIR